MEAAKNKIENPISMLDLQAQYASIRAEVKAVVEQVLDAQQFILGPQGQAFEKELAQYCGTRYAVGVASGTDALILALRAAGVKPGDEVIVPSFTFIATAGAVNLLGAQPIFAEIDPETYNISAESVASKITSRTQAIVPVHLYGQPADMDPILEIAKKHDLQVVEDNAQAIGARYKGKRTASLGDFGCISFYPSKNLGGYGDGGMILTDSEESYEHLRALRNHGEGKKKYFSEERGWNSRLDEIQAAVLRVKLRHLDEWNAGRRRNAAKYDSLLKRISGVETPRVARYAEPVYHQYTIRVQRRDAVQNGLKALGISSVVYYPVPTHMQPSYASPACRARDLPETERAAAEVLSLPMFAELTDQQIERVANGLSTVIGS